MPAQINSLNKTPFTQSKFLNFLQTNDSKFFKENILGITNSKEPFLGFCYGASVKFLHYSDKGLEQDFINTYNGYLDNNAMIQKKRGNLAMKSVADYKNHTEKKHKIKQGNKLFKEIFDIQKLQYESINNHNITLPIPLSSPILKEQNFLKLIDQALDENLKKIEYNKDRMLRTTMAPIISDNRKYAKKIHILDSSKTLSPEIDTLKETHHFIEPTVNIKISHNKINNLLHLAQISTQEKIEQNWVSINKQQNLISNVKFQDEEEEIIKLNSLFKTFMECKDKNQNYILLFPYHACAINIKKNRKNEIYQFFDPDKGIYKSSDIDEFSIFLKKYMDKHNEYNIIKDSDSNYKLSFVKLNRITPDLNKHNEKKIFDSNLKVNKLLASHNFEVIFKKKSFKSLIPKNKTYRIVHRHFDKKNHLITLTLNYTKSNNNKQKTIYSSNIATATLHRVIQNNLTLLKKTDEDIFIDKKGNIYTVAPNISMENFNLNTDPSVMFGSRILT